VTGATNISNELHGKRLELLGEFVPKVGTIAVLLNPNSAGYATDAADIRAAAEHLRQRFLIVNVGSESQIGPAFASIVSARAGAVFFAADSFFTNLRQRLVYLVASHSLPASYPFREFVFAGGLFCYGPDLVDLTYRVGIYAGRILKAASPMDLPVIQPTKFELVINLKTARTLGLTVPPTLLARADEVIE
jgi:putative ABC transport system substrate-binding protein